MSINISGPMIDGELGGCFYWVIYESGKMYNPTLFLNDFDMQRIIKQYEILKKDYEEKTK